MSLDAALQTMCDAYDRWAPRYPPQPHNPLMVAEQRAMLELWPEADARCVLDLASGSGRYSALARQRGARDVVALDLSANMLRRIATTPRVQANMLQLPFADATFDIVVAGLAIGHVADLFAAIEEIARVLAPHGALLYSDFHPAAAGVGFKRAFKDASGAQHEVPHHRHEVDMHVLALATAGLSVEIVREIKVGEGFREVFPGADEFHARWAGLPLVLVVRARK